MAELARWLAPLEAEEQQRAITSELAPWLKESDRSRLRARLHERAGRMVVETPPELPEFIEFDPEQAAAWFAERGAYVARDESESESSTDE